MDSESRVTPTVQEDIAQENFVQRHTVKELSYPMQMSMELLERWADEIPVFSKSNPAEPEWAPTPLIPIDLTRIGYGLVYVKNEADHRSNPTKTIKDRAAWELVTLYRDFARALYLRMRTNQIRKREVQKIKVPRFSLITAGNEGGAICACF